MNEVWFDCLVKRVSVGWRVVPLCSFPDAQTAIPKISIKGLLQVRVIKRDSVPVSLRISQLTEDQDHLKMTPGQGAESTCMMQVSGSLIIPTDPSTLLSQNPEDGRLSALVVQFHVVSNSEARELD